MAMVEVAEGCRMAYGIVVTSMWFASVNILVCASKTFNVLHGRHGLLGTKMFNIGASELRMRDSLASRRLTSMHLAPMMWLERKKEVVMI